MPLLPKEAPEAPPSLTDLTDRLENLFSAIKSALLHHPHTRLDQDENENLLHRLTFGDGSHLSFQELPEGGMDFAVSFTLPAHLAIELLEGADEFKSGLLDLDYRTGQAVHAARTPGPVHFHVFHISKLGGGSNSYTVTGITHPQKNQRIGVSYSYTPQATRKMTALVNLDDGENLDSSQAVYLNGSSLETLPVQPLLKILERIEYALELSQGGGTESLRTWDTVVPSRVPLSQPSRKVPPRNALESIVIRVQDCFRHHFSS